MNDYDISQAFIQEQIARKLDYNVPYYAHAQYVKNAVTDMDHFPYQRFYRGNYTSDEPIVFDREAGYRIQRNDLYTPPEKMGKLRKPTHAFQVPCSTVFPRKIHDEDKYLKSKYKKITISP